MSRPVPAAATSTTGFFQATPRVQNQFVEDVGLRRAARLFLPPATFDAVSANLTTLGADVLSPVTFQHLVDAESHPPYLDGGGFSAFGVPKDSATLVTSAGWKALQDFGLREGIVATGYEKDLGGSARVVQALKIALWCPSSAMVVCPSGMQDGATSVLLADLDKPVPAAYPRELHDTRKRVFESALSHLLDRDPKRAWTSGQWMTERIGGSDVSGTETVATWVGTGTTEATDVDGLPLGPWSVSGFKWFSSATDCGCALVLAQTPKGISCFFAPTRKLVDGEVRMNGIRIQRLKNKLGTHALPTAELEIKDMRAWLVGEEGRGVAVIATVLNVTRFHNAVRAVGYLGRGLGVARAFARVRKFPSRKAPNNVLYTIPLFAKTLAGVTVRYRADVMLSLFVATLLGAVGTRTRPVSILPASDEDTALLLRVLTSVAKAATTKRGIAGMQECMEALGGVGYLENNETPELNVARMFRDANVFSIWEGTFDVLATDTVKVLRGREGPAVTAALDRWIRASLSGGAKSKELDAERDKVIAAWDKFKTTLPDSKDALMPHARYVVNRLGDIVCATLMIADAERDGDPVAAECVRRFVSTFAGPPAEPEHSWQEVTRWDQRIAFDGDAEAIAVAKL